MVVSTRYDTNLICRIGRTLDRAVRLNKNSSTITSNTSGLIINMTQQRFRVRTYVRKNPAIVVNTPIKRSSTLRTPFITRRINRRPVILYKVRTISTIMKTRSNPQLNLLSSIFRNQRMSLTRNTQTSTNVSTRSINFLVINNRILRQHTRTLKLRTFGGTSNFVANRMQIFKPMFRTTATRQITLSVSTKTGGRDRLFLGTLLDRHLAGLIGRLEVPETKRTNNQQRTNNKRKIIGINLANTKNRKLPRAIEAIDSRMA